MEEAAPVIALESAGSAVPTGTGMPAAVDAVRAAEPPRAADLRPRATLALLSVQHGFIHAQTALLPLVFIAVTPVFGIGVGEIGLLIAVGNVLAGVTQLAYAPAAADREPALPAGSGGPPVRGGHDGDGPGGVLGVVLRGHRSSPGSPDRRSTRWATR